MSSSLLVSMALAFAPPQRVPYSQAAALRRAVHIIAELGLQPRDELKPRFARADDETKTSFTPDKARVEQWPTATAAKSNEALLAEIRALQPKRPEPPPEKKPTDLNGISPWLLILGASSYGAVSVLAYHFTMGATDMFNNQPISDDTFYVVARFSTVARYVVIAMGALGSTVCAIAAAGQLALCVQVSIGIARGELDPNAKRIDPYGGRKQGQLEKMLRLMLGDKAAGLGIEDRRQ